jgi:hypothetical protein
MVESLPLTTTASGGLTLTKPTRIGVTFVGSSRQRVVDKASLEVLPPGTDTSNVNTPADVQDYAARELLGRQATNLPPGTKSLTVYFSGVDARGKKLPHGAYPVLFYVSTSGAPGTTCSTDEHSGELGQLMVVNWQG